MKIHVMCQYYPPELGAPQARISELAGYWRQLGHEVTILTAMPNHPTGIIPQNYRNKIFLEETSDQVKVWRHWIYATPNEGFIKKTCSHLSFMLSLVFLSLFRGGAPDIYMVSSPSFFSVISAFIFSKIRGVPYIFEVRDLWPGIFVELGVLKSKWLIGLLERLELFLYRQSRHVVVVSNGFKEDIAKRGISGEHISVIPNGVNFDFFNRGINGSRDTLRKKWNLPEDKFILTYTGAIGISHGLDLIIKAAQQLQNIPEIIFLLVGEGAEKKNLIQMAQSAGLSNVIFKEGQKRECIPEIIEASDVCLVSLKNINGFTSFIPSKMFEFMAMKKPILGIVSGESAEILQKSGCARIVAPGDTDDIVMAATMFARKKTETLKQMGLSGYSFAESEFNRQRQALKYASLMEGLKGGSQL